MAQVFGGIEACVFPWPGGNTPSGYLAKDANLSDPVVGGTTGGYGSGSKVVPGIHHLPPAQALAFVRNRHTVPGGDAGRTYRQQAVIDYVLNNLKTGGVLSDVSKLSSLLGSAKEYVQFPRNWDLVQFGGELSGLTPSNIHLTVSYGAGAAVNAAAIAKYFGPDISVTASSSLTADRVLVTLGVATQAVPASLVGPAPSPAASQSAASGSARSTSGVAPALTPQEKRWAAEAKAKYGIPCVY